MIKCYAMTPGNHEYETVEFSADTCCVASEGATTSKTGLELVSKGNQLDVEHTEEHM